MNEPINLSASPKSQGPGSNVWLYILIVVVVLGIGGYLIYVTRPSGVQPEDQAANSSQTQTTVTSTTPASPVAVKVDTSDQALNNDLQDIDKSVTQLEGDQKDVNTGLNDKSADLTTGG